jgi:hypothetical protein
MIINKAKSATTSFLKESQAFNGLGFSIVSLSTIK